MGNFPVSRRAFLQATAGAVGTAGLATAGYWATQDVVRVALVGAGMRGRQLGTVLRKTHFFPRCAEVVAVCDVDRQHAQIFRDDFFPQAELLDDHQAVFARPEVEAVFIATPDHWHAPLAIAALRAGKAVYCEKPMTLTIAEGQALVKTVAETGQVFQGGTQQRSHPLFQQACRLVQNGRLGRIERIQIFVPQNRHGGPFLPQPVPSSLNWDRWLGQAPWAEYCPERCHNRFRCWYEYSGGSMVDWGAHHLDLVHWAMGWDDSGPIEIRGQADLPRIPNGYNVPFEYRVTLTYPQEVTVEVKTSAKKNGILWQGEQGRIWVNRQRLTGKPVEDLARHPLPEDRRFHNRAHYLGGFDLVHVREFLDCVASGMTPTANVASQHRSANPACHLANLALRLQRPLRWNAANEEFLHDEEAQQLLSRPQREGFRFLES